MPRVSSSAEPNAVVGTAEEARAQILGEAGDEARALAVMSSSSVWKSGYALAIDFVACSSIAIDGSIYSSYAID
jgi:hypothetical protein